MVPPDESASGALSLMSQTDNLNQQDVDHQLLRLDNYMANLLNYLKLTNHASDFRFEQVEVREVAVDLVKNTAISSCKRHFSDHRWKLATEDRQKMAQLCPITDYRQRPQVQ